MGFLLQASGRWNRHGEYGCLYTALTARGAIAEYAKMLQHAGLEPHADRERDLVSIEVEIERVYDVTDAKTLAGLGVTVDDFTDDSPSGLELCRSLADAVRSDGYSAILSPSAALHGEKNLNIYFDGLAQGLALDVGSQRMPLNY